MGKHFFDSGELGDSIDRVDGRMKVTGAAKYSAEYQLPKLAYGVLVNSTIAKGKIKTIDTKKAEGSPGVIAVITHVNSPKIPGYQTGQDPAKPSTTGQPLRIFYDETIYYRGQPIALVVADTFERAMYASSLVKAQYNKEPFETDIDKNLDKATPPHNRGTYKRGEADAYKSAPVKVEQEYIEPREIHNPMELHSTIAVWDGEDKVTVYEKTQGVESTQKSIMDAFKLKDENVQVYAKFVGGAFGSGLRTWPHAIGAVLAAKVTGRPVKLVLHREQMFTMVGYRPHTIQKVGLGATADGKLTGITHEAIAETSTYEEFTEGTVNMSHFFYSCPNVNTNYKVVALNVNTPTWMRGPGEATGSFALESAMDELAYALNMDPVELRLKNYAEKDEERNLPFSSKFLRECYEQGAEKIGWYKRNPKPGSMRDGEWLIGYGVGCGTFSAGRGRATVKALLSASGQLVIQSAVSDCGPGTATAMTNIASNALGIPASKIVFELGDSSFVPGPTQGGSTTTSTLGSAVHDVCVAVKKKLQGLVKNNTAIKDAPFENLQFQSGNISLASDAKTKISYNDILKQNDIPVLETIQESSGGPERQKYSMYSFSSHFAKVRVHPLTGVVRVDRVVAVVDGGKIVSHKTATSQMIGGVVGGIGMALMEEGVIDHRYGRYVNNNFADYHVPVHADVPHIDAVFIDKPDPYTNPMGSKGIGEISLVGIAAAIANAVYHATGKRIRELPITPDKLI